MSKYFFRKNLGDGSSNKLWRRKAERGLNIFGCLIYKTNIAQANTTCLIGTGEIPVDREYLPSEPRHLGKDQGFGRQGRDGTVASSSSLTRTVSCGISNESHMQIPSHKGFIWS